MVIKGDKIMTTSTWGKCENLKGNSKTNTKKENQPKINSVIKVHIFTLSTPPIYKEKAPNLCTSS